MANQMSNVPSAHADHLKWQSEQAAWHKEGQEWLAVCRAVLSKLSQLEQKLQNHCELIDLHHESIHGLECSCGQHERVMEMEPMLPNAAQLEAESARRHAQQGELHRRQDELHRKLKERQRELISRHAWFDMPKGI